MSSPQAPDDHADPPKQETPETQSVVETVECPSCGRRFVGDYCPDCGQEADPIPSATGVIGGFFRELADLEGGFWPTFVGLTVRPGEILRDYLSGVRTGLASPGRYLLAAVVTFFGVSQGLTWLGLLQSGEASLAATIPEGVGGRSRQTMTAYYEFVGQAAQSQWGAVAGTLVSAGFLSLLFWRLFGDRVHRWSEALAITMFTVGHWTILGAGLLPLVVFLEYLTSGLPAGMSAYIISSYLLAFAYPGAVAWGLGSGWRSAVWGALSGVLASVESGAILTLLATGYFLWQVRPLGEVPGAVRGALGVVVALYLVPLLLHAAVELYCRLR